MKSKQQARSGLGAAVSRRYRRNRGAACPPAATRFRPSSRLADDAASGFFPCKSISGIGRRVFTCVLMGMLAFALCLSAGCLQVGPAAGQPERPAYVLTAQDRALIEAMSDQTISIGCYSEFSYYLDQDGTEQGVLMPMVSLLRGWGLNVEPRMIDEMTDYHTWGESAIDIYSSITLTRDLLATYACSDRIYDTDILSITQKDRAMESLAAVSGKRVGVLQEPGILDALQIYIPADDIRVYATIDAMLQAVENDEVDVACTSLSVQSDVAGHSDLSYRVMNGMAPFEKGLVASSEELRPLIELINRALATATGDELRKETEAALDASLVEQMQLKLADEIEILAQNYDSITVIPNYNLYPFCFETDGDYEGILPETMQIFTQVTGVPVNLVSRDSFGSEAAFEEAFASGAIQVIGGVYKSPDPEHADDYSIALYGDEVMPFKLAEKDFKTQEIAGLSVGVAGDFYPYVDWQTCFGEEPIPYPDEQAVLEALDRGELDLALVSKMCIDYYAVVEERFDYDRFDTLEIDADLWLNYSPENREELNDVIDEVGAMYISSYSYQQAEWDKQILDYQQEYIRSEADRRTMSLYFSLALLGLVVLLLVAAFALYRQYRKYSQYDDQIRTLVSNQDLMDIGFIDLKKEVISSKGDWPILRKLGIDMPQNDEISFTELRRLSGIAMATTYQNALDRMEAAGEDMHIEEMHLEYEGEEIYVAQSLYRLSDQKLAFYAIDITSSKREAASLKELADRDNLTKAYRRKAFSEKAEKLRAEQEGRLYLSILDIDLFKRVNDDYGHEVGDLVIQMVADRLMTSFGEFDCVGRWGGEEFVVTYSAADDESALAIMTDFLKILEGTKVVIDEVSGKSVQVTVSAGVTEWKAGDSLRFALSEADTALYTSKKTGRNRATLFEG